MMKSSTAHVTTTTDDKVKEIERILEDPNGIDLWKLREACLSEGGLVHGRFEQERAIPVVGCGDFFVCGHSSI